jgi:hypothetical protein
MRGTRGGRVAPGLSCAHRPDPMARSARSWPPPAPDRTTPRVGTGDRSRSSGAASALARRVDRRARERPSVVSRRRSEAVEPLPLQGSGMIRACGRVRARQGAGCVVGCRGGTDRAEQAACRAVRGRSAAGTRNRRPSAHRHAAVQPAGSRRPVQDGRQAGQPPCRGGCPVLPARRRARRRRPRFISSTSRSGSPANVLPAGASGRGSGRRSFSRWTGPQRPRHGRRQRLADPAGADARRGRQRIDPASQRSGTFPLPAPSSTTSAPWPVPRSRWAGRRRPDAFAGPRPWPTVVDRERRRQPPRSRAVRQRARTRPPHRRTPRQARPIRRRRGRRGLGKPLDRVSRVRHPSARPRRGLRDRARGLVGLPQHALVRRVVDRHHDGSGDGTSSDVAGCHGAYLGALAGGDRPPARPGR